VSASPLFRCGNFVAVELVQRDIPELQRFYEENPDFRARYEAVAPGLTEYLAEGMRAFAATG